MSRRTFALAAAGLSVVSVFAARSVAAAPAAAPALPEWISAPLPLAQITTTVLDFKVPVNGGSETCNVEANLRVPSTATAAHPAPAILTTNGFGGSKDSAGASGANDSYALQYARQGYVTLSYSGLGFGHSTCQIELDSPAFDGQAGSALVDFLGGDTSKAFTAYTADPTSVTPGTWATPVTAAPPVQLDNAATHDPRVGMIGGSYGGEIQFAVADVSQRVDAIIPQITWNDLAYSLAPNNQNAGGPLDGTAPVTQTEAAPGVEKIEWVSLFSALGIAQPVMGNGGAATGSTCPNFDPTACEAILAMAALGYPDQTTMDFAHSASVGSYITKLTHYDATTGAAKAHVPVFLSQGQDDTLFNLREAITTFKSLQAQGTPVKMLWQQWGHSGGPVTGEAEGDSSYPQLFDDLRYSAWFAKYLRNDDKADTGKPFEYYTPWLSGNGVAVTGPGTDTEVAGTADTAQMSAADDFPTGHSQALYLSGTGDLVSDPSKVAAGTASFAVSPATTTSTSEISAVSQTIPIMDMMGTFASFTSGPLSGNADQVGSPTLTVNLSAPSIAATQSAPAGQLVLVAKLYDVAPDGTITLANRVVSPTRVTDVTKPVTIQLPAAVHRFPAGDSLEVVLAAADSAYKGNDTAAPVQVVTDATHVNTLSLPLVSAPAIVTAPPTVSPTGGPAPTASPSVTPTAAPTTPTATPTTPQTHIETPVRTSTLRVGGRGPVRAHAKAAYTVRVFVDPGAGPAVSPAGRRVGLYVNGTLRARLLTGRNGTITYATSFGKGRYVVTAAFYGDPDLRRSTSPVQKVSAS